MLAIKQQTYAAPAKCPIFTSVQAPREGFAADWIVELDNTELCIEIWWSSFSIGWWNPLWICDEGLMHPCWQPLIHTDSHIRAGSPRSENHHQQRHHFNKLLTHFFSANSIGVKGSFIITNGGRSSYPGAEVIPYTLRGHLHDVPPAGATVRGDIVGILQAAWAQHASLALDLWVLSELITPLGGSHLQMFWLTVDVPPVFCC